MGLSKEEKKAVDKIKKLVKYLRKYNENITIVPEDIKYFEKILDMIKTYIRMIDENIEEILEQYKVIYEMAGYINKAYNDKNQFYVDFEKNICEKTKNPKSEEKDCYADIWDEQSCRECIKQYFYRKVERR